MQAKNTLKLLVPALLLVSQLPVLKINAQETNTMNMTELQNVSSLQYASSDLNNRTFAEIFPDPILAQYVARVADIQDVDTIVTPEMIKKVTYLSLNTMPIVDLTGIEVLTSLTNFVAVQTFFTEIPGELFLLPNLTYFDISNSKVEKLPETFSQAQSLTHLILSSSKIEELPSDIGKVKTLTYIMMDYTNISSIPDSFGNLNNLTTFIANNTQITTLPESFGDLTSLVGLNMQNSQLISLPESFGNLKSLKRFYLQNNQLTSLPSSMIQLSSLTTYALHDNLLPTDFGDQLNQIENSQRDYYNDNQRKLELVTNHEPIVIHDFEMISRNDFLSRVKISGETKFAFVNAQMNLILDNLSDENGHPTTIENYYKDDIVIKSGKVYANVRATGEGYFQNTSDNALTDDKVEIQFIESTYNLTYYLNDETSDIYAFEILNQNTRASQIDTPKRSGFSFIGWNTMKDGSGTSWEFNSSTMPRHNVELFAQWTKTEDKNVNPEEKNDGNDTINKNLPEEKQTPIENSHDQKAVLPKTGLNHSYIFGTFVLAVGVLLIRIRKKDVH